MSVRFVVRPHGVISTPRRLVQWLNARRMFLIKPWRMFDWSRDFLLAYPNRSQLVNTPYDYNTIFHFFLSDKRRQRMLLQAEGFPIPFTYGCMDWENRPEGLPYVVRSLRHSQGRNYRVTYDPNDYDSNSQYISQVFPKRWEYRVVTVKGQVLCTLVKRAPEILSVNDPWNHANGSYFCSVSNNENDRLRHTDIYAKLQNSRLVQLAHLTGIDVLLTKEPGEDYQYTVCEVNLAPTISLEQNLSTLRERLQ